MYARRIGAHALRYLTSASRTGRAVSSFRHGVNVLLDETDPRLVSIQTTDVPLHPWAIETPNLVSCRLGSPAEAARGILRIGETSIRLADAEVCALRIEPYTHEEAERALARWPMIADVLEADRPHHPTDPFQPQIDAILAEWRSSGDADVLLGLVGLGIGSTPAGDDLLVGLLAGLLAQSVVSRSARRQYSALAGRLLAENGFSETARGSRQALRAAAEGCFAHPVIELVFGSAEHSIDADTLQARRVDLTDLGCSSGRAMLLGLAVSATFDSPEADLARPCLGIAE